MSASKFAELEGVDFDSPDVYETHSPSPRRKTKGLADERNYGSSDDDSASDEEGNGQSRNRKVGKSDKLKNESNGNKNGDIVKTHLNVQEATSLFRDATGIDSKGVDFSSSIQRRKKKNEYYPRPAATFETSTYVLGTGAGYRATDLIEGVEEGSPWTKAREKESPLDRFRRLRFELDELEKEIQSGSNENGKVSNDSVVNGERDEIPDNLFPQLQTLRDQLAVLHQSDSLTSFTQSNKATQWQTEAKRLIQRLNQDVPKSDGLEKGDLETAREGDSSSGTEMMKLSNLDQRLAGLESLIGVQDALQSETQTLSRPLLPSLSRIEHLLTLLTQPRHLDGISRRIKVLVSELERVHEARRKLTSTNEDGGDGNRGGGNEESGNGSRSINLQPETLKKLDTILPILSKIDSTLPIIPNLLSRLQSLSSLHSKSANFSHDLEGLEGILKTSNTQSQELKQMLENLQSSLTENETRTKENLTIVEDRIEGIVKRMEALR